MSDEDSPELAVALASVRQAAAVCRQVQSGIAPDALEKADRSPVTIADFASQAIICRELSLAFPDDPVIGEEGVEELRTEGGAVFLDRIGAACADVGVNASGEAICDWIDRGSLQEYRPRFWTLDPIDGTKGFLRMDQYAISLALIVEGRIELGVLGCPNLPVNSLEPNGRRGVLAWAVRGGGSWFVPLDEPEAHPSALHVSDTAESSRARFCESVESGHSSHDWSGRIASSLGISQEPFRIDSQCKYLAVARGDADIYLRLPTRRGYEEKIWDHAGGIILVEEAGGRVTDIDGLPPDFQHGPTLAANQGMVVTNGRFHEQITTAVAGCAPGED